MWKKGSYKRWFTLSRGCTPSWQSRCLTLCFLSVSFVAASVSVQPVSGQSGGTLRIYLARHGETEWNVERRLQGGTDTALNATGGQQAAKLRDRLKGARLDAVYSSTLSRSRETAEIVRGQVPLKSFVGLNERKLGSLKAVESTPVIL
jgi:hypothetical protein